MPVDIVDFAQTVLASITATKLHNTLDDHVSEDLQGNPPDKSSEDYLQEIHALLISALVWFKHQQSEQQDLYKFITINKAGIGPSYTPRHIDERQHFVLFSPYTPAVVLNCNSSGLGAFNLTLPTANWMNLDLPEGTQYYLDASAPANSMQFWQRETNANVV